MYANSNLLFSNVPSANCLEQNMRKVGNVASNQIYNPDNKRAPVPIDADEADSAMERFIRQKYTNNVAAQNPKPGSPRSDEGTPPPLPPKNTTKFGFRSASSIFPLGSKAKKDAKQSATAGHSPNLANKQSKVFGASVDYDVSDDTDRKLAKLRDMGFPDSQKNAIVLKGVNGNVDRAVEALIRLGEGEKPLPTPGLTNNNKLRQTRSLTPLTPNPVTTSSEHNSQRKLEVDRPTTSSTVSTNPFDMMARAQPQTAQSTGSLQNKNPYNMVTTNPFASMTQQGNVEEAFQNLNLSTSPQNITSPFPPPQPLYQQSAPSSPQSYQNVSFPGGMTFPLAAQNHLQQQQQQQQPAPLQSQPTGFNPFFSQPSSPVPTNSAQVPFAMNSNLHQQAPSPNPFARGPTRMASSPALGQIPEQIAAPYMSTSPLPLASPGNNPFFANVHQPIANGGQYPFMQQQQPQQYFQAPRHDKASIMALYNQPTTLQNKPAAFEPNLQTQNPIIPEEQSVNATGASPMFPIAQPNRSASQPLPGSNPYTNNGTAINDDDLFGPTRNISRESMTVGTQLAWQNGRHSPDAFASLSSRHA